MKHNLLVFIPNDDVFFNLKKIKSELFRQTGDFTGYKIPPVLILGKTSFNKFDRLHLNTNIILDKNTTYSSIGSILRVDEIEEFLPLYEKYEIEKINGFFISSENININIKLPKITKLKLALLQNTKDGYILVQ